MSKTKKILSVLLAAVMVVSIAPSSVFAAWSVDVTGSDAVAGVTVLSNGSVQATDPTAFTLDTSGTTEVIRVAAGANGNLSYGNVVVPKATPSGIPEVPNGTFKNVAYAGETPEQAIVRLTVTGLKPSEAPDITSTLNQALTLSANTPSIDDTNHVYVYTWNITGGTASAGSSVIYTITVRIGGATYNVYAAAHFENILRPNGTLMINRRRAGGLFGNKYTTRQSALIVFQAKNMYSGWASSTVMKDRGYIDYASGDAMDTGGNAIKGLGNSGWSSDSGAYGHKDNTNGTVVRFATESNANNSWSTDYDGNRPEATIYIDGGEGENLRNLNLRMTYQEGDAADMYYNYLESVGIAQATTYSGSVTGTGNAVFGIQDRSSVGYSSSNWLVASDVAAGTYRMVTFNGSGNSTANYLAGFRASATQSPTDSAQSERYCKSDGAQSFKFVYYDTSTLRSVIAGIKAGTGSYTKGFMPQSSYYTSGWDAFYTAYTNALICLAAPDVAISGYANKAAEVSGVTSALQTAYNNLGGYNASVNYTVNYVVDGTTTALVNAKTGTVNTRQTLKTTAPTLKGYTLQNSSSTTTNYIDGTTNITVTYRYKENTYQIVADTKNPDAAEQTVSYDCAYGATIDLTQANAALGTRTGYDFAGWFYDDETFNQPVGSSDTMPAANLPIFAKWVPSALHLYLDTKISGASYLTLGTITPDPNGPVYFNQPANEPVIEGYIFVDYYADSALTQKVEWPIEVNIGDPDKIIYARLEDVNGKISFDSNGGSAVATINYTTGTPIVQPAYPTKQGYDFGGWYYDKALTNPIPGWTNASGPAAGTLTMSTMTGFVAYAKWIPQIHTISFNANIPSTETSPFNSTNETLRTISGASDSAITAEDKANIVTPRRFGYEFSHWELNGSYYDVNSANAKYPKEDITLTAVWNATDYSAFIDISAYQKLSGELVEVDEAMRGDTITFRMTSQTNFFTGSSLFVFMYDKNFYELVGSGVSEFALNSENDYISGLNAKYTAVTDSSLLRWPTGVDSTQYAAMQIAIDPTISLTNYDTEPMNGQSWMVEFKLKIKDDATGSGTVYMDNAWTRTPENIMGTTFYGWSSNRTSVFDTKNNVVTPDLADATATVTVNDETPVLTTVHLDADGGLFPDGDETKDYVDGRAENEIEEYPGSPTKVGYHLDEGEEFVRTVEGVEEFWIEGYYPTAEIGEATYVANWKPNVWSAKFYKSETDTTPTATVESYYAQAISGVPADPTKRGYTFAGWADENDNVIDFTTYTAPDNDVVFYATWAPALNSYTIYYVYNNGGVETALSNKKFTNACYTDDTIAIVDSIPATPAANTVYVLTSDLNPNVNGYGYDPDQNTLPITATVSATAGASLTVYCKKVPINDTFNGVGGTFASTGTQTRTYAGIEGSTYNDNGITAETIEIPVRIGYEFTGYTFGSGTNLVNWSENELITGRTWRATWAIKSFNYHFSVDGVVTDKTVQFNATITAPSTPSKTGYTFKGWSQTSADDIAGATTSLGKADTEGERTYYAVFQVNQYNVEYKVNGSTTSTATYDYGTTHNYIAKPTDAPTGYEFAGWYLNGNTATAYGPDDTYTVGDANITITGNYVAKQYDVIFNANGGKFANDSTSKTVPTYFDDTIAIDEAPSRSGYRFLGWSEANDNDPAGVIVDNDFGILETEGKTYYAVWEATENTYYVDIYKMDIGGTTYTLEDTEEYTGTVGQLCDAYIPNTNVEGFTFDSENSVLQGTVTDPESAALRLVVKYTRDQHDVYTTVEGTTTKVATYYYGETIAALADPDASVKPGYTFTGWTPAVPSTMGTSDVTVEATWNANKYTVSFYASEDDYTNNNPYRTFEQDYGTVILPATTTKTGYTFAGFAVPGSTTAVTFGDTTPTVEIGGNSYIALWTVNEHTLTYKSLGTNVGEPYTVAYGTPVADFPNPGAPAARDGYEFTGWNYSGNTSMPDEDLVVTATWKQESYTIVFDVAGGEPEFDSVTALYGEDISGVVPQEEPTKTGYTFAGWSEEIPETMPDVGDDGDSKTITAQWTINQYSISYVGFNSAALGTITKDYNAAIASSEIPAAPEVEGYKFTGWSEETPANMPAENKTITANYAKESYTITVDANGGKFADDTTSKVFAQEYATAIAVPADPTREGYTFAGWSETIPTTMPDLGNDGAAKTITATWTINQYTISYVGFDGVDLGSITKDYNAAIDAAEIPAAPSVVGYEFIGWSEATPATMPAENKTITAQYSILSFTLTISANGGAFADSETQKEFTQEFGTAITAPADPTWEGHTFKGWSAAIPATMPAENKTITATWDVNEYTITFVANGGEFAVDVVTAEVPYDYGEAISAYSTEPTKEGYEFDYWYADDPNTAYVFDTMPAKDLTLTAHWTIKQYTIYFETAGGTSVASITKDFGAAVAKPADPYKEGHKFLGWYEGDDSSVKYTFFTMPSHDVYLTADWETLTYSVKFYDADLNVISDEKYAYGTSVADIVLPTDPTLSYYTFEGWNNNGAISYDADDEFDFTSAATVGIAGYSFYPIFVKIPVELVAKEGSTVVIETKEYPVEGIIYGLEFSLTEDKLLEDYIGYTGSGRIQVTPSLQGNSFSVCGTGALVELFDTEVDDTQPIAVYHLVIFGDINGDGLANAADASIAKREASAAAKTWSDKNAADYEEYKLLAADFDKDGVLSADEATTLTKIALTKYVVDQTTGAVSDARA